MKIEGPLKIGVIDNGNGAGHQLEIKFTEAFQGLPVAQRVLEFRNYVSGLRMQLSGKGLDDDNRQGVSMVLQISEQLLNYIESDEIPLNEIIMIDIEAELALSGLLKEEQPKH
ncbi:MAG: hypothetical protein OEY67_04985 [Gammaproteobacteria bacterium]|nr:hypothetical protein [Gammaproteobacteria bacterium]